jgi:hypothetical protein
LAAQSEREFIPVSGKAGKTAALFAKSCPGAHFPSNPWRWGAETPWAADLSASPTVSSDWPSLDRDPGSRWNCPAAALVQPRCDHGDIPVCLPCGSTHMGDTPGYRRADTPVSSSKRADLLALRGATLNPNEQARRNRSSGGEVMGGFKDGAPVCNRLTRKEFKRRKPVTNRRSVLGLQALSFFLNPP